MHRKKSSRVPLIILALLGYIGFGLTAYILLSRAPATEIEFVDRIVEKPIDRVIEKIIDRPVDRIVEVEKRIEVPAQCPQSGAEHTQSGELLCPIAEPIACTALEPKIIKRTVFRPKFIVRYRTKACDVPTDYYSGTFR